MALVRFIILSVVFLIVIQHNVDSSVTTLSPKEKSIYQYVIRTCSYKPIEEQQPCVKEIVDQYAPAVIERLENIVFDPFKVAEESSNGQIKFDVSMKDLRVKGANDMDIHTFNVDFASRRVYIVASGPRLRVDGKYDVDGRVTFIPIVASGTFWITADDVYLNASGIITENSDGTPNGAKLEAASYAYGLVRMRFNNIVKDDEILGEAINAILNENAEDLIETMKPHLIKHFTPVLEEIALNILAKTPDEL